MYVIHHTDNDGNCAAAIVKRYLGLHYDPISEFIPYNYDRELDLSDKEFRENELVYIVDLSLNMEILKVMKFLINEKKCKVVHIDHHATTIPMMERLIEIDHSNKEVFDKVIKLYKEGVSGALLTYVYSCMTDEEREHPSDVQFDFTEPRTHFAFYTNTNNPRGDYGIPTAIRYIDDYDIWKHEFKETKAFNMGTRCISDMSPDNDDCWDMLENNALVMNIIDTGVYVMTYQNALYSHLREHAFVTTLNGVKCICINTTETSSDLFGDLLNEYPMSCTFAYDGATERWVYSLRSADEEDNPDSVDVAAVARSFGGGGHKHAAGFTSDKPIFYV